MPYFIVACVISLKEKHRGWVYFLLVTGSGAACDTAAKRLIALEK